MNSDLGVCRFSLNDSKLDEDAEREEIYLSLSIQNKTMGASFYNVNSNIIYVVPDIEIGTKFEILINFIIEIRPQIFISTRQVYDRIKDIFNDDEEDNMTLSEDVFSFVTLHDISYNLSLRKMCDLSLPMSKSMTDQEKSVLIHSLIPTQSYNMIRSCGGLLKFIEKKRNEIELEAETYKISILDIQIFTLADTMYIDEISLRALNIFNKISHPSGFKQGGKMDLKEGASIFSLLNNCNSKMASNLLYNWIRRPLTDLSTIQNRLDCVEFFQNSYNHNLLQMLQRKLRYIGNIKQILSRMKSSTALINDWSILVKSISSFISISEIFSSIKIPLKIASKIEKNFTQELYLIASWINKIIDIDGIDKQKRFVVKEGVDLYLDEKKSQLCLLPDLLTNLAEVELSEFNEDIQICGIVYLPQLGYLLTVPDNTDENEYQTSFEGMKYLFSMNNAAYYKNHTTRKLDKEFGDILYEIKDIETAIMHHLQESILEHTHILLNCFDIVTELDCLLSLAIVARQFGGTRPIFKSDGGIEIKNGRHPLQELYTNPFIANSTYSNTWNGKVMLITGANGSGKSVYLKQVGILIILAQIGSFVPADKMTLTPQKAILTRLKSMESSLSGLSTFMVDLNQLSVCCKKSSSSSTILIDEFGKGVEMKSGIALLASFLRFMLNKEAECPHIFLVTHFHRLYSLIPQFQNVQFKNFNVMEDQNGQLIYLYKLIDGHIECSHAIQAAKLVNIPDHILNRAKEISESYMHNKLIKPLKVNYDELCVMKSTEILKKFVSLDFKTGSLKENLSCFIKK